jgi:hypothetical protein
MMLRTIAILLVAIAVTEVSAKETVSAVEHESPSHAKEIGLSAIEVFKQLSELVGEWRGRFPDGREHRVSYRLTAAGSTLVETWALAPGRESMTLYHLDGDELLATHYCPQGNQPRLRLVPSKKAGRLSFVFKDGSNLAVPNRSHQHSMWIELGGAKKFTRSETYIENGTAPKSSVEAEEGEAVVYTRIEQAAARN